MRKTKNMIILTFIFLFSIRCATIFKGNSNKVDFNSNPQGAQIYINGKYMGETPIRLKLESKRTYNIEFKKEGYKNKVFNIQNHVGAGWIILDVIGGLIPVIVDAATGAWYELDKEYVNVMLERQQTSKTMKPQEIKSSPLRIRIIKENALLRLYPNKNSTPIKKLSLGLILNVEELEGNWIKVKMVVNEEGDIISGYIHKDFVVFRK